MQLAIQGSILTVKSHSVDAITLPIPWSAIYVAAPISAVLMILETVRAMWMGPVRTGRGGARMTVGPLIWIWLGLMVVGMPIFLSMGFSCLVYLWANGEILLSIPQRLTASANSFPLLAAPFFMLTGMAMNTAGVTTRIYDFCECLAGRFRGGLAHVNVIGSVIFAGMSGSAVADAAGLGTIEIKAMTDEGYPLRFRRRRDGGLGHDRSHHSSQRAAPHLRCGGGRVHRAALRRRVHPGSADGGGAHGHDPLHGARSAGSARIGLPPCRSFAPRAARPSCRS